MTLRAREWPIVICPQSQPVDTLYKVEEDRPYCKTHCNV